MYNSLQDPNISLACNLLDACRILDERARAGKARTTGFGPDINNESFPQLFSMACYMSNALRGEGLRGVYRSLPFAHYYRLRQTGNLPKYWLTVRMLSLLPRFASGKKKRVGAELIPPFLLKVGPRAAAFGEFNDRGGHKTHCGLPLSFVPEMDAYWLGEEYIDVFHYLEKDLKKLLIPMSYAEYEETRPFDVDSESKLIGNIKQLVKESKWITICALFFSLFFPDRLQRVVDPTGEYGIPGNTDGLLRFLGDAMSFAPEIIRTIFIQGFTSVYLALADHGIDVYGRDPTVLGIVDEA